MAFTYGFYDSINHDRKYNNEQLSSIFNGIILDGVFKYCPIFGSNDNNDRFEVTPSEGMNISVGRGKAWFNNTWNLNSTKLILTVGEAHNTYDRYDAVVLEVNADIDKRENSIKIIKGKPSATPSPPELKKIWNIWQYALAYIYVPANTTEIISTYIQNVVGTDETPYVQNIAEDVTTRSMNSLDVTNPGFMLDARQGKVLDDKIQGVNTSKININQIKNNLTTEDAGYVLDARQGKVLKDYYDTKIGTDEIAYNLTTTREGYVLGANQGKVLNDGITSTTSAANSKTTGTRYNALDTTAGGTGRVLDAYQGYILNGLNNNKLNKSDVKDTLGIQQAGQALDAHQGYVLNNRFLASNAKIMTADYNLKTSNKHFQFGVDGSDYGYYVGNTFYPFLAQGYTTTVNLGNITSLNVASQYPELASKLSSDNFYIDIKGVNFEGGISAKDNVIIESGQMGVAISINPNLTIDNINVSYNSSTGWLTVSNISKTANVSYVLYEGTSEWHPNNKLSYNETMSVEIDYDVIMLY